LPTGQKLKKRASENRGMAATEDPDRDLILRAQAGDKEAMDQLWVDAIPIAKRRAALTVARYFWLDADDIESDLLKMVPRFVHRFKPEVGKPWKTYCYFSMVYEAKDICRAEDPLGIKWPHKGKGHYPEWHRLGDEAFQSFDTPGREAEPLDILTAEPVDDEPSFFASAKQASRKRKNSSIKCFLKYRKNLKYKKKKMEEPQQTETVPTEENFTLNPAPKPRKKSGRPKGSPPMGGRPKGTKRKAAAKSAKGDKTPNANDQLILAMRFVDSVGSIRKCIELLEILSRIRK
jgi:hypothetical protein